MCFRKFWNPKMFKNQPPDRLWGKFLYQSVSKNHARLTGSLKITRKPQNSTEIDPKIFPGRRQRRSLLNTKLGAIGARKPTGDGIFERSVAFSDRATIRYNTIQYNTIQKVVLGKISLLNIIVSFLRNP